ncbi:uncharacterized protein LOC129594992 [Paramacrobiotus metropolitanus]|uniref:uncharacterized protein LOC129594992 n=1 Tax=Paramacrobiotus metropolitanus TaxID=2943436 RepID=UPI002445FD73|nr:uncharacterized protein LOC129594992 [Paramacrobiotus metropolitanus]
MRPPYPDTLEIYEEQYGSRRLVKSMRGYQSALSNPTSVAQLLSYYTHQPSFSLQYLRQGQGSVLLHEVLIDFVVVEGSSNPGNTYCSALRGYVNSDYICDHDYETDRCNCPSSYTDTPFPNPANARDAICGPTTQYTKTVSVGKVIGVLAGVAGFICIILGVNHYFRRRRRLRAAYAPYQRLLSYQNTPPSYS